MLGYWVPDGERKRRRDGEGASGLIDLGSARQGPMAGGHRSPCPRLAKLMTSVSPDRSSKITECETQSSHSGLSRAMTRVSLFLSEV
jgi:hypothetical protein